MSIKDITVVITSFKSDEKLKNCLNSIDKQCKVIIVENSNNLEFKKNQEVLVYKNQKEFIKHIIKLKINGRFANNISRNAYKKIKTKFTWSHTLKKYNELI